MTYPNQPPAYPPQRPTNVLAIIALIAAFVFPVAGIVLGLVARNQIKRTGEAGEGLAVAGFWVGIAFTVLAVLIVVLMIVLFAATGTFIFGVFDAVCQSDPTACN